MTAPLSYHNPSHNKSAKFVWHCELQFRNTFNFWPSPGALRVVLSSLPPRLHEHYACSSHVSAAKARTPRVFVHSMIATNFSANSIHHENEKANKDIQWFTWEEPSTTIIVTIACCILLHITALIVITRSFIETSFFICSHYHHIELSTFFTSSHRLSKTGGRLQF